MSEQFSKLNKLGHTLSGNKKSSIIKTGEKPMFVVGNFETNKSRDLDDDNNSSGGSSCGTPAPIEFTGIAEKNFQISQNNPNYCVERAIDGLNFINQNPEITIQDEAIVEHNDDKERIVPPSTLNLVKNISHSSSEVDSNAVSSNFMSIEQSGEKKRCSSEQDLSSNNITTSQSESAIKSIKTHGGNVASPVANTAKEILSPFTKFAKGVQTFGANLDPRKLKSGQTLTRNLSDQHLDQRQKLIERWQNCRSSLIAL